MTPQSIDASWDQVGPLLDQVAATMTDHNLESLCRALLDVNIRMYLVAVSRGNEIRAIIGVELIETALGERHMHIAFVSGQNPKRWIEAIEPTILDWARSHGCIRATGLFRRAFLKMLPHWKSNHVFMELDLVNTN